MSVTDDIIEEIVQWCSEHSQKEYSRDLIREDWVWEAYDKIVDEVAEKLKAKGIAIES